MQVRETIPGRSPYPERSMKLGGILLIFPSTRQKVSKRSATKLPKCINNFTMKVLTLIILTLFCHTGCATYVAKSSYEDARMREAIVLQASGQNVELGIDLLSVGYLKNNWKVAVPAAILDGVVGYYGFNALQDYTSGQKRDTTYVVITGDNNSIGAQPTN
jgi:hypothetical protein